ncbi:MAG: DUF5916 domain-containing protein [Chitinophagaceae bacterium]
MRKLTSILFITIICFNAKAQVKYLPKEVTATRTTAKIKIDAVIDETAWKTATLATSFVEWRPAFGKIEDDKNKTEIYLLYDDAAFYVAGFCHESNIDSISKELVGRDMVGVNDFVGVIFDTYNDKINGFGYYVTPLGEQFDAKYSSTGEDGSWNSVFESSAKIVQDGWVFEMKIPYAAIRFVAKSSQNWGLNITRRRSKSGQQLFWNAVDPAIGGSFLAQFGLLNKINDIKPPVRLSFSPYLSVNSNHYPYNNPNQKNLQTTLNGGMDVKYGINQAFTLDMTLVPDFGQVQSDNRILNLGPFEVKYNEFRSFFTEGTELFSKGNLFYSRRIGGFPTNFSKAYDNLLSTDSIINNPIETKLINATKISGRTSKGLGIGVLNAVTAAQYATILDKANGATRDVETSPLTNYNIFVLDQTLKNNSSISLINTSVIRSGADYDANVTAALWDFYDKKNTWNLSGKVGFSNILGYGNPSKNISGYTHSLNFGKTSGRFNFNVWQELANDKYQQNDLGYFTNNNYIDNGIWVGYKWLKPKKWYNRLNLNFDLNYSTRLKPWDYQNFGFNTSFNGQLKNLWNVGINIYGNAASNDFYDPRVNGYVFKRPQQYGIGFWINTNEAKKYYNNFSVYTAHRPTLKGFGYELNLYNQFRFNNNLTISLNNYLDITNNGIGFAFYDNNINAPVVGLRQRITAENTLNIKYNFNNKMGINFRTRHYWSKVRYEDYQWLQSDGTQTAYTPASQSGDANFNTFNVDMTYTWQFALGSFITINWKDFTYQEKMEENYFKNLSNTLASPQSNSISIKIIYFLDYLDLVKKR